MSGISYIIPAFNASATLRETVESIYRDNFHTGDEVIIVDDCSTDQTLDLAQQLADQYTGIRLLRHHTNKGSANAGRNTGIDIAKNELLFNLDADNMLVPGSVKLLREHLLHTRSDAAAFGEIHFFINDISAVTTRWKLRNEISFIANINAMAETPGTSGNYMYTRTAWKKAGRCNEFVGGAFDSLSFSIALLGSGARMTSLNGTHYYHRIGHESASTRDSASRNRSLLFLQMLLPYMHELHEEDVNYIMSAQHRTTWAEHLDTRPLRSNAGATEHGRTNITHDELPAKELVKMLGKKIKRRLGGK